MIRINFILRTLFIGSLLILTINVVQSQNLDYPELYRSLGLPQYNNAIITELGRQNISLKDGLKIYLESPDNYATLRAYYEGELASTGWDLIETIASKKMREMGMLDQMPFGGVFKKENMTFQIFSNRVSEVTKITISVVEE
jgi:hypothetical protein